MNLADFEENLIFSIMRDLTGEFDHVDVCQRIYK